MAGAGDRPSGPSPTNETRAHMTEIALSEAAATDNPDADQARNDKTRQMQPMSLIGRLPSSTWCASVRRLPVTRLDACTFGFASLGRGHSLHRKGAVWRNWPARRHDPDAWSFRITSAPCKLSHACRNSCNNISPPGPSFRSRLLRFIEAGSFRARQCRKMVI